MLSLKKVHVGSVKMNEIWLKYNFFHLECWQPCKAFFRFNLFYVSQSIQQISVKMAREIVSEIRGLHVMEELNMVSYMSSCSMYYGVTWVVDTVN